MRRILLPLVLAVLAYGASRFPSPGNAGEVSVPGPQGGAFCPVVRAPPEEDSMDVRIDAPPSPPPVDVVPPRETRRATFALG